MDNFFHTLLQFLKRWYNLGIKSVTDQIKRSHIKGILIYPPTLVLHRHEREDFIFCAKNIYI
jgi:hypothetical protein